MNHWAIAIGINQYHQFQPLGFAQRDAQAIRNFWVNEAGFAIERCLLMTDASPPMWGKSTYPTKENIQSWLQLLCRQYLAPGDVLWFFFSGYGVCEAGHDYLVPIEASPRAIAQMGIAVTAIYEQLAKLSTNALLVLLDINRNQGSIASELVGQQVEQLARQSQVPTILSCRAEQFSRESNTLKHGFFTAALLESLRATGTATVDSFERYLHRRLPELCEQHLRPIQQPVLISPVEKTRYLLLPMNRGVAAARENRHVPVTMPPLDLRANSVVNDNQALPPQLAIAQSSLQSAMRGGDRVPVATLTQAGGGQNLVAERTSMVTQNSTPMTLSGTQLAQTVQGKHSPESVVSSESSKPEPPAKSTVEADNPEAAVLWRRLLLWGGIGSLLLLLGVLAKTWSEFFPPAVAPVAVNSAVSEAKNGVPTSEGSGVKDVTEGGAETQGQPSERFISDRAKPSLATPDSSKPRPDGKSQPLAMSALPSDGSVLLAIARTHIKSDLATPYWNAIQAAQKIPADSAEYQLAQQEIAAWNREIWAIARRRVNQGELGSAIWAASLISPNQSVYKESRPVLAQWCRALSTRPTTTGLTETKARNICRDLPKS
ncbi:MAG TPA: caspase family protein [Leptolyngbyaceae cyanobacterium M33_DOE_097]|uniref:Peptidase C14 caspase domain-containing protein n=1 Tax=Oscillatoriales cyanobacterium SpSt-418 TaxID=2282169 RepID=A0A7C3PFB0_9CYAN|nr:caspase family protein [Leptolyngbyaceae cyanobacterium M33_DOE_097]